jgi:DNA-directed RNA polymerase specialized sigma24 family protein
MQDYDPLDPQEIQDRQLQDLALEAKQHPPQSNRRCFALNGLIKEILQSNRLGYPRQEMRSMPLYTEIRNEAIHVTLLEVCERIADYRPEKSVMAWVNSLLKWRFLDVLSAYSRHGYTAVPRPSSNQPMTIFKLTLEDLEHEPVNQTETESESETERLRHLIMHDPDKQLTKHIRDRPEVTLQALLLLKLEDLTLEEMSQRLPPPPISVQTLASFLNRNLRNLRDYFQNHL